MATFAERKSHLFLTIKIPDWNSAFMQMAMNKFFAIFGKSVKKITTDNGMEFSKNKRLRWFFPNKINFEEVNNDQVLEDIELINSRPLKVLN